MDSGGGGGDDYSERQAAIEASKAAARRRLNYLFGEGSPADFVDREQFYKTVRAPVVVSPSTGIGTGLDGRTSTTTQRVFDQAAYDAAVAAAGTENPNKASREALYSTIRDNAFNAGKRGLDETKTNAERSNKFELFARGLNGGSEDIDQNALLNRTYNQGLLDLGAKADAAKTAFKSNDEATRLNLLQSIDAGMDQSSALSSAVNQMKNASDQAAADAQGTTLGNLFDSANLIYSQSQARKGKQDALDWWNTYNSSGSGRSSSAARNGTYSST